MKDIDLRGIVLQQFYDHRKNGMLGIRVNGMKRPTLPAGCDDDDFLRICAQLAEAGLLDWHTSPTPDGGGYAFGCGKISGAGVDVIEVDGADSPIPIHIDQSQHHQTINISGSHGAVQVGGANSQFQQGLTRDLEKLIEAVKTSPVPEEEKKTALEKLGSFLATSVAGSTIGVGVKLLAAKCGITTP